MSNTDNFIPIHTVLSSTPTLIQGERHESMAAQIETAEPVRDGRDGLLRSLDYRSSLFFTAERLMKEAVQRDADNWREMIARQHKKEAGWKRFFKCCGRKKTAVIESEEELVEIVVMDHKARWV